MSVGRSRAAAPAILLATALALGSVIAEAAPASAASPVTIGAVEYSTISGALAAATPGAVIRVAAGTYFESLAVHVPVTLVGSGSSTTTIVAPPGSATALALYAKADVSGLTIEGQSTVPGTSSPYAPSAVQIAAGGAGSYLHNDVLANGYQDVFAQGVTGSPTRVTRIEHNTIRDFHANQGSGVWIANSTYFTVSGNRILNGTPVDAHAVGVNLVCGSSHINVASNSLGNVGHALVAVAATGCTSSTSLVISGNTIARTAGSALLFGGNNLANVSLTGNVISHVGGAGDAISISGGGVASPGIAISAFAVTGNSVSDALHGLRVAARAVLAGSTSVTSSDNRFCSAGYAIDNLSTSGYPVQSAGDDLCGSKSRGAHSISAPASSATDAPNPSSSAGSSSTDPGGSLAITGGSGSSSSSATPSSTQVSPSRKLSTPAARAAAGFPLWLGILLTVLAAAVLFFVIFFAARRRYI